MKNLLIFGFLLVFLIVIQCSEFNPPCHPYNFDLNGKVGKYKIGNLVDFSIIILEIAIVTGANVGLGLYSAKALAGNLNYGNIFLYNKKI
jgi:hypothetical protein